MDLRLPQDKPIGRAQRHHHKQGDDADQCVPISPTLRRRNLRGQRGSRSRLGPDRGWRHNRSQRRRGIDECGCFRCRDRSDIRSWLRRCRRDRNGNFRRNHGFTTAHRARRLPARFAEACALFQFGTAIRTDRSCAVNDRRGNGDQRSGAGPAEFRPRTHACSTRRTRRCLRFRRRSLQSRTATPAKTHRARDISVALRTVHPKPPRSLPPAVVCGAPVRRLRGDRCLPLH